ncbi:MAG: ATP-binding cassette domain-containing protein, partial [Desulfobacterales bacterium]|nr:ATP-binding cassette domain-containing protein [Desulfobacterales bacterium]
MALISMRDVSYGFGGPPLLEKINFQIEKGERVCLLGRNGVGKSSLMKLISGELEPDGGEIILQKGARIARLSQHAPTHIAGRVIDVAASGCDAGGGSESGKADHRVESLLTQLKLEPDALFETLSAGLKRQVTLARALASRPDLLLLDEPTNHLDIDSITRLEDILARQVESLVLVTHDRVFLQKLSTRILDIDRGRLTSWAHDYQTYLKRKEDALSAEETRQALFDKKLSREEVWIRKGVKERRTRNEGRVRALKKMREMRKARREKIGSVKMAAQEAGRSGKLALDAEKLSYAYSGKTIIKDFSATILRGDKVGIIGPNGAGKTTLLSILLGSLEPSRGKVRRGSALEIVYFDQLRGQLDKEKSVRENVLPGAETVKINGRNRHVIGYLKDFLFTPERSNCPVRILSGGERNRLLLAKIFTRPSNLLVLDEPTNDLDAETLELLEELLLNYSGAVLLVSHDRAFLNNVVTSTLVFEADGEINEYVGGYDDWCRQRRTPELKPAKSTTSPPPVKKRERRPSRRKLTFNETRELEALPRKIETLEAEREEIFARMAVP